MTLEAKKAQNSFNPFILKILQNDHPASITLSIRFKTNVALTLRSNHALNSTPTKTRLATTRPSPMPAVPSPVITELQRQLNDELAAAHSYLGLALWCDDKNLKGFARFFHKQSSQEREHAQKFMEHLLDRGILPTLTAIPAPELHFDSLLQVAHHAQALALTNTAGIHRAYEAAVQSKDYPAQIFLHWYIQAQVEEEAWTEEMVTRAEMTLSSGGLGELDRHIESHLAPKTP